MRRWRSAGRGGPIGSSVGGVAVERVGRKDSLLLITSFGYALDRAGLYAVCIVGALAPRPQ